MTQATARATTPGIGKPSLPRHRSLFSLTVLCVSVPPPPRHRGIQYQVNACTFDDKAEIGHCTATYSYCDQELDRRYGERSVPPAYLMPELKPAKRSRRRTSAFDNDNYETIVFPLEAYALISNTLFICKKQFVFTLVFDDYIRLSWQKYCQYANILPICQYWQYKVHCVIYCQYGPQYLAIYCQNV